MLVIRKTRYLSVLGFVLFFTFTFPPVLVAEVPDLINYQGVLTDDAGIPVPDGNYAMDFTLYTTEVGDTGVWSQTFPTVSIVDGIYNVKLGPFIYPEQIFVGDLYLQIEVNGEVLAPRQQLTSVPYALNARVSDTVVNGAITTVMMADGAVDSQKIANDAVTGTKIANGTVSYRDIQGGSGSLLDADKLDGLEASEFMSSSADNWVDEAGDTMTGPLSVPSLQIDDTRAFAVEGGNIYVGYGAGDSNTTGYYNTFVGHDVGASNTTGHSNTFIGYSAGVFNTTGHNNTFFGHDAGSSNIGGIGNTFVGHGAGKSNTDSAYNTFVGSTAGGSHTNGSANTFLGDGAGYWNISGMSNVFLGFYAGFYEEGSNKLYIANSGTSDPLIYGEFDNNILKTNGNLYVTGNVGIGTTSPGYKLDVAGRARLRTGSDSSAGIWFMNADDSQSRAFFGMKDDDYIGFYGQAGASWGLVFNVIHGTVGIGTTDPGFFKLAVNGDAAKVGGGTWASYSDARLKDIGERYERGLEEITKIEPVKYRYKEDNALGLPSDGEYVGLIAQEVEEVIPEAVEQNEQGYLMLKGDPINYAMLNAIKELKAEVEFLKKRIDELEKGR